MPIGPLSIKFAALCRSHRRAILARLVLGETSVRNSQNRSRMSMPAVSKHLKVLEHAGLVTRGPRGAVASVQDRTGGAQGGRTIGLRTIAASGRAGLDRLEEYLGELCRPKRRWKPLQKRRKRRQSGSLRSARPRKK